MAKISRSIYRSLLAALGLLLGVSIVQGAPQEASVSETLRQLKSEAAAIRITGLSELLRLGVPRTAVPYNVDTQARELLRKYPGQAEEISDTLIAALEQENLRVHSGLSRTETDSEHYADLIAAVAALGNPKSSNALTGALNTGGMAMDGLAELGASAVPAVFNALRSDELRRVVPIALQKILSVGDVAVREAVRKGLLEALSDTTPEVRMTAVSSLGQFRDPEVTRAIETLAIRDTFTTIRNGERIFPVRTAAEAWLREQDRR